MSRKNEKELEYYLALEYGYTVIPDEDEFYVRFPDLPGCMTQVERAEDIHSMAQEIKELWLKTALEANQYIAEPVDEGFSGKFLVRVPKTLHRDLVHQAKQEGMSLNSLVMHLLSSRSVQVRLENLVVSAVARQPNMRHSSPVTSGSHDIRFGEPYAFIDKGSDPQKQAKASMQRKDRPSTPGHTLNPKLSFAS